MKQISLLLTVLLFSLSSFADPRHGGGPRSNPGNGGQRGSQPRVQQPRPAPQPRPVQQPRPAQPNRNNGNWNNGGQHHQPQRAWNDHSTNRPHNNWQNNNRYQPAPNHVPHNTYRYNRNVYIPQWRAPYGVRPAGHIWWNGGWCRPPVIRYAYNTVAWAAIFGVFTYYHYTIPANNRYACVISMDGDVVATGAGYDYNEAQQVAILNCNGGGYGCDYNYYSIDCGYNH